MKCVQCIMEKLYHYNKSDEAADKVLKLTSDDSVIVINGQSLCKYHLRQFILANGTWKDSPALLDI